MTSADSLRLGWLILVWVLAGCGAHTPTPTTTKITGPTMGTSFTVLIPPKGLPGDATRLRPTIEAVLERVNGLMSTYQPTSEISRFNRSRDADAWFPISAETQSVVAFALAVSGRTGGAFDITVGPLVNLWKFGPPDAPETEMETGTNQGVPSAEQVARLRARVGHGKLECRDTPPALRKRVSELAIDLSAIAKGYAVDAVCAALDKAGVEHYFVDVGGEIRTRGWRSDGTPWRIGIEAPLFDRRTVHRILRFPRPSAVATSGDYRNYREIGGKRYSHTIDPRTGRPVEARPPVLCSVTVARPTCMEADALATALMVMGWDAALAFCEREKLSALLIARGENDVLIERESTAFTKQPQ